MAINLVKGQRIEIGLSKVGVGLGWDPNEGTGFDFDLDASAFMLGENKKLLADDYFVFYNNTKSPDGAVESSGDDLTGGNSDGDDETLTVDLIKVDSRVQEIVFTVTIHDFEIRKQNFGQVRNSFIRIYNAQTNEEIAKYELDEDFSVETAVEFGRLYKKGREWKFEAMGIGYKGGLQHFVDKYL
ncbi:MAG: TerD family protein [Prevotellaceae bacterium]|jgi:tellurium resistance protein TerD|nr:TerD family protein [Prevotellaceae bacterium]